MLLVESPERKMKIMTAPMIDWEPMLPSDPFAISRVWKVVASAGAGKSYSLRKVILDLIESSVPPEKIMYLIYNKNPAAEFRATLESMNIDPKRMPWIGTHHSIARRLLGVSRDKILTGKKLKEWGKENGFPFSAVEDDPDCGATIWDETLRTLNLKLADCDDRLDPYERKLLAAFRLSELDGFYTHDRYLEKAIRLNLIPKDVEYVLFDESQDNNRLQFGYINYLKTQSHLKGIMLAGDDKQAINIYRGGRPNLFFDFEADRYVCLGKTFRNPSTILSYANNIAGPIRGRSPLTSETDQIDPGKVELFSELEDAVQKIKEDIRAGLSVFLLSRLNEYKYRAMGILRQHGVPIQSKSYDNMKKVFKAMRVLADKFHLQGYFTFEDLLPVLPQEETESGELNRTAYWKRGALKKFQTGEYSLDKDKEIDLRVEYEMFVAGETKSDEVDFEAFGFLPQFLVDIMKTRDGIVPKGVWRGMSPEDVDYVQRIIQNFGVDSSSVWPSTIHGAKGAECDVAVILTNINYATRNTEEEDPDAERRVYYTAVTRARKKVYITAIWESRGLYTELL